MESEDRSTMSTHTSPQTIVYPDSDGLPMSDNTLQFQWITTLVGGLDSSFREDPDVFVAGDLLWYPIEGDNKTRTAPDALVVFGRPKGYRGSYMQWREEGGVAPQTDPPLFYVLKLRFFCEPRGVERGGSLLSADLGKMVVTKPTIRQTQRKEPPMLIMQDALPLYKSFLKPVSLKPRAR
jgi:hypothetical protein